MVYICLFCIENHRYGQTKHYIGRWRQCRGKLPGHCFRKPQHRHSGVLCRLVFPSPPSRLLGMDKPFQQSPELRILQGYKVYRILVEEPAPLVALFGYSARKGHRVLYTIHIKRLRTRTLGNRCSSIGGAHRHVQETGHTFRQGSRDMAFRPHATHGKPLLGRLA